MSTPFHLPPHPPGPKSMRRVWPWILLAVLVLLVVVAIIGATPRPGDSPASVSVAPSQNPCLGSGCTATIDTRQVQPVPAAADEAPAKPAGPAVMVTDGTYQVGVDMAAGRYKTTGPDKSDAWPVCYWARKRDDSGQFGSIITNSLLKGPGSVTVKAGEFFEVNGGCTWTKQ